MRTSFLCIQTHSSREGVLRYETGKARVSCITEFATFSLEEAVNEEGWEQIMEEQSPSPGMYLIIFPRLMDLWVMMPYAKPTGVSSLSKTCQSPSLVLTSSL